VDYIKHSSEHANRVVELA